VERMMKEFPEGGKNDELYAEDGKKYEKPQGTLSDISKKIENKQQQNIHLLHPIHGSNVCCIPNINKHVSTRSSTGFPI
jgi:hypothetical protein